MDEIEHKPVLVSEVIETLGFNNFARSKIKGKFIDATLGLGGYEMYLKDLNLEILAIEADLDSLNLAKDRLRAVGFANNIIFENGNFRNIVDIARKHSFLGVDIILFDLGISSYQLNNPVYGLSFKYPEAMLDMRIDRRNNRVCARDILNFFDLGKLKQVFELTLNKRQSFFLAQEIVQKRKKKEFRSVEDLLQVVDSVIGRGKGKIHPATKVFLALRMVVNSELDNLKEGLVGAFSLLNAGGRLGVISFHSGEDRIVKRFFADLSRSGLAKILSKKPIVPLPEEVLENPRARSAKLRVVEKYEKTGIQ